MKTRYLFLGLILAFSLFCVALTTEIEEREDNIECILEEDEEDEEIEQIELEIVEVQNEITEQQQQLFVEEEDLIDLITPEEFQELNEEHEAPAHHGEQPEHEVHNGEEGEEGGHENVGHDGEAIHHDGEGHEGATHHEGGEHAGSKYTTADPGYYFCIFMATFLVTFAGICSGLTVGYLSIDDLGLEIKLQNGTEADKRAARAIIPILKNHHVLLCTLLISNAIAMEALPIFLDAVVPAYMAIIVSTVAVVVVGEIIPQAYCTGPSQLLIAEKMAPLVKGLICFFTIFNVPIAYMLDKVLGIHGKKRYKPDEIEYLVQLYESMVPKCLNCSTKVQKIYDQNGIDFRCKKCEQDKNQVRTYFQCDNQCLNQIICNECFDSSSFLYQTEVTIFQSIIEKINDHNEKEKKEDGQEEIEQILISQYSGFVPIEKLVMVSMNDRINKDSISKISNKCYSNILVRDSKINDIVGVIKAKSLIPYINEDTTIQFKERMVSKLLFIEDNLSILQVINEFKKNQTSLALIIAPKGSEDKYKKQNNRQQDIQALKQNKPINVEQYSSLVPTQELFRKHKSSRELEHNGQKILGLLTIKDLFEYLINIDFGESNKQDEEFRRINHVEDEPQSRNNTQSLRKILGQNTNQKRTIFKAASKFKKPLSNNNLEEPSQADIVRQNLSNAQRLDPGIPDQ